MGKWLIFIGLMMAALLSACVGGNSDSQAPAAAAAAAIALDTLPNPPAQGDVELRFTVKDAQGNPVSGADFDVIADHTDMSGMTLHGKATDQGGGVYSILTNFSMSGNWKLTVQVRKDGLDHKEDIPIIIR